MDAFKTTTVLEILIFRIGKINIRVIRQNYSIFPPHKTHIFLEKVPRIHPPSEHRKVKL